MIGFRKLLFFTARFNNKIHIISIYLFYNSKSFIRMATEEDHEHGVDQMKVLIKKAKRAMHEKIMEDPNKDYNDVYKEALADVQVQIGKL